MIFDVLRLGHRSQRDKRITTHLALVSRLFGCRNFILTSSDKSVKASVDGINRRFGGNTQVIENVKPSEYIKKWNGISVHLTMYGEDMAVLEKLRTEYTGLDKKEDFNNTDEYKKYNNNVISDNLHNNKQKNILFIAGAEKVPAWIYDAADYNVSIGNQPHSEVAALAIALVTIFGREPLYSLEGGEMQIVPCKKGKNVKTHI